MVPEVDLTDDAGEQVVHLHVDQRRHLDVLAVVRVGDRLAFCNHNKQSKCYFCFATSCNTARIFPSAIDLNTGQLNTFRTAFVRFCHVILIKKGL